MITYYERLNDGTIGMSTTDLTAAEELELTLTTDEEIIIVSDGLNGDKCYLKSEFEELEKTAEYQEKEAQKEHSRIQGLIIKKQDFIRALKQLNPIITYAYILDLVKQDDNAFMAWDTCQEVYRNDKLIEQFLTAPPLNLTVEQIDALFDSVDKEKARLQAKNQEAV